MKRSSFFWTTTAGWLLVALLFPRPSVSQEAEARVARLESPEPARDDLDELEETGESEAVAAALRRVTPGGRLETWIRERRKKSETESKDVETPRRSRLERGLIALESGGRSGLFGLDLGGIMPRLGGLPSGSGIAGGAHYRASMEDSRLALELETGWSSKAYQKHGARFGALDDVAVSERGAFLYGEVGYLHYPQEDLYGAESGRTDFLLDRTDYSAVSGYRFARWLRTSLRYSRLDVSVGPGSDSRFPDAVDALDDLDAPGLLRQPSFGVLSYSITADTRKRTGNPHSGGLLDVSQSHYRDSEGAGFDFRRTEIDGRYYLPLGSRSRVLALRALGSWDAADSGERVPFFFWPTLGGSRTLRGFDAYRFRGDRLLHFSAEYRWEPVPAVELALFYDAGRVSRTGIAPDAPFERSAGAGIRFQSLHGVVLRLDAARSREGTRVILDFGPSF